MNLSGEQDARLGDVRPGTARTGQSILGTRLRHFQKSEFVFLSKRDLHQLADELLAEEDLVVQHCVDFVCAETEGLWHGRARALMCRRLKHIALNRKQSTQLVECISHRFTTGAFSEQFKDQLRLALSLNAALVLTSAEKCQTSLVPHVRRYATWLLNHSV